MPLDYKIKYLDIFVLLVPLEIVSHYPDIDSIYWLREDAQWIMDKFFRDKLMVQMAQALSRNFL